MSHIVIDCTCGKPWPCPIPGHDMTPPNPVDPNDLVAAGREAFKHLDTAVVELMRARAAWVKRGLPADNAFPKSLDSLAENITFHNKRLREWTDAAMTVAARRTEAASA